MILAKEEIVDGRARPVAWAVASGALYVGAAWSGPKLFSVAGLRYGVDAGYLATNGLRYAAGFTALGLPSLIIIAIVAWKWHARSIGLASESACRVLGLLVAAAGAAAALDHVGLWPFVWRWKPSAMSFAANLLAARAWGAGLLILITLCFLNPFVEEVAFRFGVFAVLRRTTRSNAVAVIGSSALFTAIHFGPGFRLSSDNLAHAAWLFLFGVVLSIMTIVRSGRVWVAVGIHAGRNLVEQLALMLALTVR